MNKSDSLPSKCILFNTSEAGNEIQGNVDILLSHVFGKDVIT